MSSENLNKLSIEELKKLVKDRNEVFEKLKQENKKKKLIQVYKKLQKKEEKLRQKSKSKFKPKQKSKRKPKNRSQFVSGLPNCFRTPKCTPITPIIRVFHVINKFHASKLANNSKRRYFLFIKQVK